MKLLGRLVVVGVLVAAYWVVRQAWPDVERYRQMRKM